MQPLRGRIRDMKFRKLRIAWSVIGIVGMPVVLIGFQQVRGDSAIVNWNPEFWWPLVIAFMIVVTAPWLSYRFDLRTALIVIALVAVMLCVAVAMKPVSLQ